MSSIQRVCNAALSFRHWTGVLTAALSGRFDPFSVHRTLGLAHIPVTATINEITEFLESSASEAAYVIST